jgi:hypothetical protein
MRTLSAEDFARLLYSRVPGQYRARDVERNLPLLALLRVIGSQASNLRHDLDSLWDNFFIETCDDWVVPYLGKLLGTRLLANPVGQSDRLDVWNTVAWRRSKGTPRMLQALSTAITGWPTDFAEFFQQLGWSQNLNHLRPAALLTPDLRDSYTLSLLGKASDTLLHAADFKPAHDLDQPRASLRSLGIGRYAWGTPGRYQIKNIGFFVRRLRTFPVAGVTPASIDPGGTPPPDASCFTFNPLHREVPLFSQQNGATISRSDFANAPWDYFGTEIAVRQYGVLLAASNKPQPAYSNSSVAFTFGFSGSGLALDATEGMRLLETTDFQSGGVPFVITARWQQDNGTIIDLGALNTAQEALNLATAFKPGAAAADTGILIVTIQLAGPATPQWILPPFIGLQPAEFPGAILALRAAQNGPVRVSDGLYVYLPPAYLVPGATLTVNVADDGSTYYDSTLSILSSAREAEGQVYPQWNGTPSAVPAVDFTALNRGPLGLVLPDPSRFGGSAVLFTAELYTGTPQTLGSIATIDLSGSDYPLLNVPSLWPAFTFGANPNAITGAEINGLLDILVQPLSPGSPPTTDRTPPTELVFAGRDGESLLIYLPEITAIPPEGVRFFVADDGSTYYFPASDTDQTNALNQESLAGLVLARASAGQTLAIPGLWPLQQRRPVALNLCRCERTGLLHSGELGIDPELGRFGFAPGDPSIGTGALTVDIVEAVSDSVGAVNFDRQLDPAQLATRIISSSGDADTTTAAPNARIYKTLSAALAESQNGDILEFADSATYAESGPSVLADTSIRNLTIRARAGKRPCLTYYTAAGVPAVASLLVLTDMQSLTLNGLLFSGGPLTIHSAIQSLQLIACTLDPPASPAVSLLSDSTATTVAYTALFCRCITGPLRFANPSLTLTIADSILDAYQGIAIANTTPLASPPVVLLPVPADATVQLERVTVLGRIYCDILSASESLLDDYVFVEDQQSGCVRFCRYESGSVLPRRFQCVPTENEIAAATPNRRVLPPLFNSRRYSRPAYMQLASACPAEILTASTSAAEVGAFASTLNAIRLSNLAIKLQEFMPVGLTPVIIAET